MSGGDGEARLGDSSDKGRRLWVVQSPIDTTKSGHLRICSEVRHESNITEACPMSLIALLNYTTMKTFDAQQTLISKIDISG